MRHPASIAYDSSAMGTTGPFKGQLQRVPGPIGGALKFDGVNDYVSLPIGSLIRTLTDSTFAIWVNFSQPGRGLAASL